MKVNDTFIQLKIEAKGLLSREALDFSSLLKNCRLEFENHIIPVSFNQKAQKDVGLLYNKLSMARGIFFDGRKMKQGVVKLGLSLPTTHSEICDFIRVVSEIKIQYRNVQLISDDMTLTLDEFVQGKENYLHYSLATLRELCHKNQTTLQLISFPYTLTPKEQKLFSKNGTLEDLQILLHRRQTEKRNDAGLELRQDDEGNEQAAFSLVANYPSVMPIKYENSIYLEEDSVDSAVVCFYSQPGVPLNGDAYDYEMLIQLLIEFGAEHLDEDHLTLPGFTEDELMEIATEFASLEV